MCKDVHIFALYVDSKDTDQQAKLHSLIKSFKVYYI